MACQAAVGALHAGSVFEEIAAEGAAHDVVEGLLYEFVAVLFHHFFFALSDGSFAAESDIKGSALFAFLDWVGC